MSSPTPDVLPPAGPPDGPTAGPPTDGPRPADAGDGFGYVAGGGTASLAWLLALGVALAGTRLLTQAGVHRAGSPLPEGVRFSRPWPPAR